ncbi:arginine--tRNA ligase [Candidatus Saccharibacteria bacterium RIFCSPHIGHO2_02_FULL_47_12]|nr:MAG: arginine--tRNA ligase [Candidatus Saccharibacteria bacterium RIFCSPHIGHO2_02_FULL_47_12]
MEEIKKAVSGAVKDLFGEDIEPVLTRPDEQFGDYSTNVAMQLAGKTGKNPREIAEALAKKIKSPAVSKIELAGPGFLNIILTDEALIDALHKKPAQAYAGKTVVIEHTDPNPFKEFHIGHAYSNTIGESIRRLYKAAGASVHQVSYHGDVGLHVAMAIYGLKQRFVTSENFDIEPAGTIQEKVAILGQAYALGAKNFRDDPKVQEEIKVINTKIYEQSDSEINNFYELGRNHSFIYFDSIYKRLNVGFEKQYFESMTGPEGIKIVEENLDKVFEKSDGAIVFKGEKFDLHTRVFVNSQGLPTYEAKELGLAFAKQRDYNFDEAVVVTANEIDQYFQVLLAALGQIDEDLAKKIKHVSHGVVKLPSGKMSSRTGDVITAVEVLDMLGEAVKKAYGDRAVAVEDNVLAALKYVFLKHRIGGDIVFDINESISLEGNSGPYLQYAHARARSILSKKAAPDTRPDKFEPAERSLLRKITEYAETVDRAVNELMPHHICTYLYELAQKFNSFYEHNRVLDDPRESVRLQLVQAYADTLKNGLDLLNISAPEKM